MRTYLSIAEIIVAVVLIIAVLTQVKGTSGGVFGGGQSTFRTRRGVERIMFQFTLVLGGIFVLLSIASLLVG
ncbi:MAG: preprotein translocase subunit SecG [Dehalococcoidia bacterium]|nr:preprotein translocase subunit SecG [Dehalococcoidia bacterium]